MNTRPTMECPACGEIEFEHTGTKYASDRRTLEYTCATCHTVGYYDEKVEDQ